MIRSAPSTPFAMLVNPEVVLAQLMNSQGLAQVRGRICRPLDRPLIARTHDRDLAAHDAAIDEDDEILDTLDD